MAVITKSALISEIRGSVGNVTYSRNRAGAIAKAKLIQTNPDTIEQQAVRATMADGVQEWQNLSQQMQDLWLRYVSEELVGKSISRKVRRTAMNEFVSRWMNRFAVGGTAVEFFPLPKVRLNPVIQSVEQTTGSIILNINTLRPIGNCNIIVYATHPLSPGINMINKSFFRIIGVFTPAAQLTAVDIYSDYVAKFPLTGADVGKKIGIAIRAVNSDNFAAGQFFFVQAIISGIPVDVFYQVQLFTDDYYQSSARSFLRGSNEEQSHMNKIRGKLWKFYNY